MNQEKVPIFENSKHQVYWKDWKEFIFTGQPRDRSIFVIFLAFSRTLEIYVNSTFTKFLGCKMTEKRPKILDQITKGSSHGTMKKMQFLMGKRHLCYAHSLPWDSKSSLFD